MTKQANMDLVTLLSLTFGYSLCLFTRPCQAEGETGIYIDLVSGYKNLSDCAETPLSRIVRNMESGCGDGAKLTSYSCFCTNSYSKFSWDISTAVVTNCNVSKRAEATSAVAVFEDYCSYGTLQLSSSKPVGTVGRYYVIEMSL